MVRHIKSCLSRYFQERPEGKSGELYYLHVRSIANPDYFLHVLIPGDATLENLDTFLRGIWLECCGHMSAFSAERYGRELDMRLKIKDVLFPGAELTHMYDFGDTTELSIKGIDTYFGHTEKNKTIQIVARNAQPLIPCDECGQKPAVEICQQCQWDGGGWLCEKCADQHDCDDEMFVPVVNSPRTGVCGYTGE
jgi:hypothetical protein